MYTRIVLAGIISSSLITLQCLAGNYEDYVCIPDGSSSGANSSIFEIDGHCLNSSKEAWQYIPYFIIELQLWEDGNGNPIPVTQVYGEISSHLYTWNHVGIGLEFINDSNFAALINDNFNSIIFNDSHWDDYCQPTPDAYTYGCEISYSNGVTVATSQIYGEIVGRKSSDIILPDRDWALPGVTDDCHAFNPPLPRITSTMSHELGHGLGVGHRKKIDLYDLNPYPIMAGWLCPPLNFPISRGSPEGPIGIERQDLDFLFGLAYDHNKFITAPEHDTQVEWLVDNLDFAGVAHDEHGDDISEQLEWISSISGLFCTGAQCPDVELEPGQHIISIEIPGVDGDGRSAQKSKHHNYKFGNSIVFPESTNSQPTDPSGRPVITVNVNGPVTEFFRLEQNPCFIQPGQSTCTTTLHWEITGDIPAGMTMSVQDSSGSDLSGGSLSGSVVVSLSETENQFSIIGIESDGTEHVLRTITGLAGELAGSISSASACEIEPPETQCEIIANLNGFAEEIILYDAAEGQTLFDLQPYGPFTAEVLISVPHSDVELELYSNSIAPENLLDSRTISSFQIADEWEYNDFVGGEFEIDDLDSLTSMSMDQVQENHNFHDQEDVDYIRIPHDPEQTRFSMRAFNISAGLEIDMDVGCRFHASSDGTYTYESLSTYPPEVITGPRPGSKFVNWVSVTYPDYLPECLGGDYFVKITRTSGMTGEDATYDMHLHNGYEDIYEPDDIESNSTNIYLNETQSRNFARDKTDWLIFYPSGTANYDITIQPDGDYANPCIEVYEYGYTLVGSGCSTGQSEPMTISVPMHAHHTMHVTNPISNPSETNYTIQIKYTPGAPDSFEQDDSPATATAHPADPGTNYYRHNFFDDGHDYFWPQCLCITPDDSDSSTILASTQVSIDNSPSGVSVCSSGTNGATSQIRASDPEPTHVYLCDQADIGPNTDYDVIIECECDPPPDPDPT